MPWIRLDPNGARVPDAPLKTLDGGRLSASDFRARSNLVIFVSPPGCDASAAMAAYWAAHQADLRVYHAQVLVIVPTAACAPEGTPAGVHFMLDPEGEQRRRYGDMIARPAADRPMLFVVDRYGVPYAAWTDHTPGPEVYDEALEWVQYIDMQCPE